MKIIVNGPEWAHGCGACTHGILYAPDVRNAPLYIARAILAHHGEVIFCDCKAGQQARRNAEATWREIAADRDRIAPHVLAAILAEAARTPTVHAEVSA